MKARDIVVGEHYVSTHGRGVVEAVGRMERPGKRSWHNPTEGVFARIRDVVTQTGAELRPPTRAYVVLLNTIVRPWAEEVQREADREQSRQEEERLAEGLALKASQITAALHAAGVKATAYRTRSTGIEVVFYGDEADKLLAFLEGKA